MSGTDQHPDQWGHFSYIFFNKSQLLPIKHFCLWHTAVLFDNRSHEAMLYRCHGLLFVFAIASGQVMSPHQSNVPKVKSIFEGAFLIFVIIVVFVFVFFCGNWPRDKVAYWVVLGRWINIVLYTFISITKIKYHQSCCTLQIFWLWFWGGRINPQSTKKEKFCCILGVWWIFTNISPFQPENVKRSCSVLNKRSSSC